MGRVEWRVDVMGRLVVPCRSFEVLEAAERARVTWFGGVPDFGDKVERPRIPAPPDPEVITGRGNEDAARMTQAHFAAKLPCPFVGQIDLSFPPRPQVNGVLENGRLQFLYQRGGHRLFPDPRR